MNLLLEISFLAILSRKEQTQKSNNQVAQGPRECEPSKEGEIRCWRSKNLLLGIPHPSHITWTFSCKLLLHKSYVRGNDQ